MSSLKVKTSQEETVESSRKLFFLHCLGKHSVRLAKGCFQKSTPLHTHPSHSHDRFFKSN